MRKLIFLLMGFFIWNSALSQITGSQQSTNNIAPIVKLNMNDGNNVAKIQGRAYTATTSDTTEWLYLANFKNVFLTLQSKDTCTLLINYQLSADGATLGVSTLLDSLSVRNTAGGVKSLNFSTTSLGTPYGRFILSGSSKAFAQGTAVDATYTAVATFEKY